MPSIYNLHNSTTITVVDHNVRAQWDLQQNRHVLAAGCLGRALGRASAQSRMRGIEVPWVEEG